VRPTLIRAPGIIAPALVLLLALNGVRAVAHEHAYIPKDLTDAQMDIHGYIALGLGVVFSMALGGGLMALVFYSNRKGYDR